MHVQIHFDKARDSFVREVFLNMLEWDLGLADIEPQDTEMIKKIEEEPLVYNLYT